MQHQQRAPRTCSGAYSTGTPGRKPGAVPPIKSIFLKTCKRKHNVFLLVFFAVYVIGGSG